MKTVMNTSCARAPATVTRRSASHDAAKGSTQCITKIWSETQNHRRFVPHAYKGGV